MKRPILRGGILVGLVLSLAAGAALARGTEDAGNTPLGAGNYGDWPGIMAIVNHPSRVYHTWVNGNEFFYYHGDTAALNDALLRFAETKVPVRQVLFRPEPGDTTDFAGDRKIPCEWTLHLNGGIAAHVLSLDQGKKVWSPYPTLTIYVDDRIDLGNVTVPNQLTIVKLEDLKRQMRAAIKQSTDKTVRGWGSSELAALDPYDTQSRDAIAERLKDPDNWVRLNAAGALAEFGKLAEPVLPQLRAALQTEDSQLKERLTETIQKIDEAPDETAFLKTRGETLKRIDAFIRQPRSGIGNAPKD
jgi:hypothetical protein